MRQRKGENMTKISRKKKVIVIVSCVVGGFMLFALCGLLFAGYRFGWGPFYPLADHYFEKFPGNAQEYAVENVEPLEDSPLDGMDIAFLGSSVTLGASSVRDSFADYIAVRNGTEYVKDAVSATTLVDEGLNSYISRLKKMDKRRAFDLFVVQLSTNDASTSKPLGTIVGAGEEYDTHTVCGAMEYIRAYVEETWSIPVVFYTNAHYESEAYEKMVGALYSMQEVYGANKVGVIDLYSDEVFNDITQEERELYMADHIHPTRAGYLLWWTPKMEAYLYDFVTAA